jgi:hypothetical protein
MLTPLEKSVLDTLLDKSGEPFDTFRRQLSFANVSKREFSGVGFFTELALPDDAPVGRDVSDMTLGDVGAQISGLEHGAGFVLFIRGGAITMLEGYSYDEKWPNSTDEFKLFRTASGCKFHV